MPLHTEHNRDVLLISSRPGSSGEADSCFSFSFCLVVSPAAKTLSSCWDCLMTRRSIPDMGLPNQFSDAPEFGFSERMSVGWAPIATRILSRVWGVGGGDISCNIRVVSVFGIKMRQCPVIYTESRESTHLRLLSETNLCSSGLIVKCGRLPLHTNPSSAQKSRADERGPSAALLLCAPRPLQ